MLDFDSSSNDLKKTRTIVLDNNKIYLKQKDPYGYWYVNFDKGQIPKSLQGAYTDVEYAYREVKAYLDSNSRKILEYIT